MSGVAPERTQQETSSAPPQDRRRKRRRWLVRLAAILFGLGLVASFEGICILFDWGRPTQLDDPFVGFSEIHPLFERDASGENFEIPPSRRKFFAAESFPVKKPNNGFRIFVLGGSTVQGRPFSAPTSFTTWLELALREADPKTDWDVVNCGGVSYASYRLAPILQECLQYQPDLFILCSGHNEFLEDRTYAHLKNGGGWMSSVSREIAQTRTFTLIREAVDGLREGQGRESGPDDRPVLTPDVDVILNYQNGADAYHRDDDWHAAVVAHYAFNIRRMVDMAASKGIPLLLVLPPSNLGDCPPFKSEHRRGLSEEDRARFHELFAKAQQNYRNNVQESIRLLREALEIDDRYALAWYELGQCLETVHEYAAARRAFVAARDQDICPLRMVSAEEAELHEIAAKTGTPLLDAHALLEATCPDGILDGSLLVDHVHPSFHGHQLIATALVETMTKMHIVQPTAGWREKAESAWKAHFQSLDEFYFNQGAETLRAVQRWAAGRAQGPPAQKRFPNRFRSSTGGK